VGDTSSLQNAVFRALAHHRTREAYELLKTLLVQDPPVFDNESEYSYLFRDLGDSLALSKELFPELLQLGTVSDYKENIQSLMASLVDSGYLKGSDYESWFSQLYFDAKIQWKKQEGRDERRSQKKEDDDGGEDTRENTDDALEDQAILLMPFYDRNATVPHFFNKLLQSRDGYLRLSTAVLMLRHNKPVPDSIIHNLAANDLYRSLLFRRLTAIHKANLFPKVFRNQVDMARSLLAATKGAEFSEIQLVDKMPAQFKENKGVVYFFKYKVTSEDEWQIGLSGLQPVNPKDVNAEGEFVSCTGKKLRTGTPARQQFAQHLKKLMYSRRKSAAAFYQDISLYGRMDDED
jgi:hypothetical protein